MAKESINDFLDDDCLSEILSNLVSISDIVSAQKVCTRWHRLCAKLWKDVDTLFSEVNEQFLISKCGRGEYEVRGVYDLAEILKCCGPFILHFNSNVINANPVTFASVFTIVSEHCKNLEDVYIRMPERPSTFRLRTLLNDCFNLKTLYIYYFTHEMAEDLSVLQSNNIKLKSFSFAVVEWFSMNGNFFKYLPEDLEELSISTYIATPRAFFFCPLRRFKNLRSFECHHTRWYEHAMEPEIIGGMETLVKLSLIHTLDCPGSFNYLVSLVNLKDLDLSYNYKFNHENLINIVNNCKQIEILNLSGCDSLTDNAIISISIALEKLKSLKIDDINNITDEPMAELPSTLVHLSCKRCDNVKVDGIINLMKKPRNGNMTIILNYSVYTDALIASAREIIDDATHHISFRIIQDFTIVRLTKNETETPSLISIEGLPDNN